MKKILIDILQYICRCNSLHDFSNEGFKFYYLKRGLLLCLFSKKSYFPYKTKKNDDSHCPKIKKSLKGQANAR